MGYQIAIDGPCGSGKSTIAKLVAAELGFVCVDTGAMYRAVGYYAQNNGINLDNAEAVLTVLPKISIEIEYDENKNQKLILNGINVTEELRSREAGESASKIAVYSGVREKLTKLQQKLAESNNIVMDGRDIGSNVLKNADLKVYIDADAGIRAKRRCDELKKLNLPYCYDTVKNEILLRDHRDKNRKFSPLKKAEDAYVLDTGNMNVNEVVNKVKELFIAKIKK